MTIYPLSKTLLIASALIAVLSLILYFMKKSNMFSFLFKNKKKPKKYKKYVKENDIIYNALLVYPQLEDFLYYEGAKSIKNPIVKKSFTKKTTFASLAKSLNKDVDEFMFKVNSYVKKILEE